MAGDMTKMGWFGRWAQAGSEDTYFLNRSTLWYSPVLHTELQDPVLVAVSAFELTWYETMCIEVILGEQLLFSVRRFRPQETVGKCFSTPLASLPMQ